MIPKRNLNQEMNFDHFMSHDLHKTLAKPLP